MKTTTASVAEVVIAAEIPTRCHRLGYVIPARRATQGSRGLKSSTLEICATQSSHKAGHTETYSCEYLIAIMVRVCAPPVDWEFDLSAR